MLEWINKETEIETINNDVTTKTFYLKKNKKH